MITDMDKNAKKKLKNAKRSSVSAVDACPEILDWVDNEQNDDIDIHSLTTGSNVKVHFKCPKCGTGMYRKMYRFLIKQADGSYHVPVCQTCAPTVPKSRVWLTDAVPDIDTYWNNELNGGHKPSEYSASSSEKVWTNCPICGTPVKRNVRFTWAPDENGVGRVIHCRTCGKRKPDNTLTEVFPSIVDYWVYDKNRHKPEYYTISSGKKSTFFARTAARSDMLLSVTH